MRGSRWSERASTTWVDGKCVRAWLLSGADYALRRGGTLLGLGPRSSFIRDSLRLGARETTQHHVMTGLSMKLMAHAAGEPI